MAIAIANSPARHRSASYRSTSRRRPRDATGCGAWPPHVQPSDYPAATARELARRGPMRIAVIADVHGNLFALEAVLNDLRQHSPDVTVDLGDCVSGPLRPFETAELLMSRQFLTVRGNHDRIVTGPRAEMGRHNIFSADRINERHI